MKKDTHTVAKKLEDTEKIAKSFLSTVLKIKSKNAIVVGMYGDLGTGKTTFVKNIAKILNVKKKVNSPTFVIIKKYLIKSKNHTHLFHIDAYRLKSAKEIKILGWEEMVSNPKHLVFIEWPERIIKAMPKHHQMIFISHRKDGYRNFEIRINK